MEAVDDSHDASLLHLLQATVRKYHLSTAHIRHVASLPIGAGLSGAAVRRYRIVLEEPSGGTSEIRLITKAASLVERRVFAVLNAQGQPNVPFSHTLDLHTDASTTLCMDDVGDTYRPTSREPITPDLFQREAQAIATIHHANFANAATLAWLPCADQDYFVINLRRFWQPAWEKALAQPDFVQQFAPYLKQVAAAAEHAPTEMAALCHDDTLCTLIHTDINPSNVLMEDGKPYLIDWHAARRGSVYVDVPHHFCTLAQAEYYRAALADLGREIPVDRFAEGYRVAARYIGLRYLWWTLDAWRADHAEEPWVLHYLHMIVDHM